uniref:Reverse transcriptase domain-containing protein n=1 Tax=Tanacetum cinerariifolium TaxID=118510 RepID=A0A699JDN6_TANCI|nr:reverse transcriptase domain-containing protein [Tanacetum cinerariifolium]
MNTASSLGLRTLLSITTRSGIVYKGPTIPTTSSPPKVVERETMVTKDTVPPTNNGSIKDVQPTVVQVETQIPNSEPVVTLVVEPVEAPIFQDLNFNISFSDALILISKFASTIKSLLTNKEKLFELARTPLNEHCSAVLLKKLTEKLGDLGKFHFPADFVVVDFDADPRVPLILGRSYLRSGCALIDVYKGELTLYVGNKVVTFNLDQTSRYSANYDAGSINRIDVIDVACEEYSQEVLGFFISGNPTPSTEPIVSTSFHTLTPLGDSDFLLEETDAFLAIEDEPVSPEIGDSYYDSEGDILLLNDDPSSPPLPPQELKVFEPKNEKSFIDEPPGDDKLPVISSKGLKDEEITALIKVLRSHKQALAWKLSDIKSINPEFYTQDSNGG